MLCKNEKNDSCFYWGYRERIKDYRNLVKNLLLSLPKNSERCVIGKSVTYWFKIIKKKT